MIAPVMAKTVSFGHDDLEVRMVVRPKRALDKTGRPGRVFAHHASGPPGQLRIRFIPPVQDEANPQLPWRPGGVVSEHATGPAGFVQGPFGPHDHPNFEVVVPEGNRLRHYWRDHSQSA